MRRDEGNEMTTLPADGATAAARSPVGERPAFQNIRGFDGLRAIAVMMVLVAHAGFERLIPGGTGVTIFFVISGFLITKLLLQEISGTGTVDLRRFYIRRFLRLGPELLSLIILCLVFSALFVWRVTGLELGAAILYYMNYYTIFVEGWHRGGEVGLSSDVTTPPWRHLWSLAVEEHFYLIWPISLIIAVRTKRVGTLLLLAAVAPLIWRYIAFNIVGFGSDYNYMATDTRIDSIAFGCIAAYLVHDQADSHRLSYKPFLAWWIMVAALAAMVSSLLMRSEEFRWVYRFSLQNISLFLIVLNLLYDSRWKILVEILEFWPVRWIGRISYGLYLYHMLVNKLLGKVLEPGLLFMTASVFLSILIAAISFYVLEKPVQSVRRKFGSHVR